MHKRTSIKHRKNNIHFPINIPQEWRNREGKDTVEEPIRGGRKSDGRGTNLVRVDFRGVGPGGGTPGCREGADEEVGYCDDGFGDCWVGSGDKPRCF